MAFQQALSGLNVATKKLDVIGNNVANGSTVGFKQSRAEFSDVFAASAAGVASASVGIGAQITGIAQQFTQGNISSTSNPTDLAIAGNGFFRMQKPGVSTVTYSRNGQFQVDRNGFIVNNGLQLTGYAANPNTGVITPQPPVPLQVTASNVGAQATTSLAMTANVDAGQAVPAVVFPGATPTAPDPLSYNHSTQVTVYDSLGAAHALKLYFAKTAAPLAWNVFTQFDNTAAAAAPFQTLTFTANGVLTPPPPILPFAVAAPGNGAAAMSVNVDLTKLTQFAGTFGVSKQNVDGFATGSLTSLATDSAGIVSARFSNGQTKAIGQVVLVNFANPQGLQNLGSNQWGEVTTASGSPVINAPGSGNAGTIQSAALEDSNVDLTAELVNMITAQRFYQANAQAIKTQDQVIQTLLNGI